MGHKIAVIVGTVRPGNYTSKALALVQDELKKAGAEVDWIDPAGMSLQHPGHGGEESAAALQA